MSTSPIALIEMLLSLILPIGWGFWELRKLRIERARDAKKAADKTNAKK